MFSQLFAVAARDGAFRIKARIRRLSCRRSCTHRTQKHVGSEYASRASANVNVVEHHGIES
jgi:hypothetical protein